MLEKVAHPLQFKLQWSVKATSMLSVFLFASRFFAAFLCKKWRTRTTKLFGKQDFAIFFVKVFILIDIAILQVIF